ncbi:MAG TPA: histidine kinase [Bacteroidales bacterium]|nr:histidine kinase [Bacteroidales bacterium]
MQKEKKELVIRVVLHILVWGVLLGLPFYSARRISPDNDFLLIFFSFTLISALIFYSNYLILVPRLFFQKSRLSYYISAIALVVFFYFVSDFTSTEVFGYIQRKNAETASMLQDERREMSPPRSGPPPGNSIMGIRFPPGKAHLMGYASSSVFMVFLSLGLKVLERQTRIEKMQEEMEKAKLNTELAFLKNQISPHFFFNTLNNIYSLIGINAEDSQRAVLKLSKLMRYLLYESEQGNVMLGNEIEFMKNYIDLMRLRMNERISLNVEFPSGYEDVSIPPLLFIPFIENAFKHGISNRGKSFINISLNLSKQGLEFACSNSNANREKADKRPGIGLENVTKRLNLLFPGKHDLRINRNKETFEVILKVNLS